MLLKIHPDNPDLRKIHKVKECLEKGGVIIYPTDTVYSLGCDVRQTKAISKVAKIKGIKPEKANFSLICNDLSHLAHYAKQVDNQVFKIMRSALPGAYTFILPASSHVPKLFQTRKKTVGIRVPDNKICHELVSHLDSAIISTSIYDEDEVLEYTTDPELIYEKYKNDVDMVIDGGYGRNEASTVIDCSNNSIELVREGLGPIDFLELV